MNSLKPRKTLWAILVVLGILIVETVWYVGIEVRGENGPSAERERCEIGENAGTDIDTDGLVSPGLPFWNYCGSYPSS